VKVILERIDTTRLDLGVIRFLSERARREFFHPGNRAVHLLDIIALADNEEVLISMFMLRIFDTAGTCHDRGFMAFEWHMSDTCHGVGHHLRVHRQNYVKGL
jgi:hypothetical protein